MRCREGGLIEHSIVRAGFTITSVGTVLLDVLIGGVVAVALIQTLLLKVVRRVAVEECSEVFPAMCTSSVASERRDTGREMLGKEKVQLAVNIVDFARFGGCML